MTLDRYTQNLHIEGNNVISYTTHVATIDEENGKLYVHGYWSVTTSKHINYVAQYYGLEKVEQKAEQVKSDDSGLQAIAMVAMLGNIFGTTQKESNDWKTRMLKAGLQDKGLTMPDDWEELSEDEKQKRLDNAIGAIK